MPLSVNVGLDGVSPVQGGGAENTGNYALGVSAAIYNQYFVDLKYVDSFGETKACKDGQTDGSTPMPWTANRITPATAAATPPSPAVVLPPRTVAPCT